MQNKTKVQNITKGAHSQTITHETMAGQNSRDIRYPTIPPAKTRTYHCASDRQTDRQADRLKKPSANYGKTLLKRLLLS